MIPYFTLARIPLGPVSIQVWGLFVALGIGVAAFYGGRLAARAGLDRRIFLDFATEIVVAALIASRIGYVLAYEPSILATDPLEALRVWHGGFSSFGGFVGAALAAAWFAKRKKITFAPYADVAAFVLPLGYGIGRIGCFLIHDHIGVPCPNCALAVAFSDGPRLDHGLLLSLTGFGIFAAAAALKKMRGAIPGKTRVYLPLVMMLYGIVRFALDFFRAWDVAGADTRYLGLTPAQYGCIALVAGGAWLAVRARGRSVIKNDGA